MNRLVLIGNGFDLAHDLKTSYANFMLWYYKEWGERLLKSPNKAESDDLCSFTLHDIGLAGWYLVWGYYYRRSDPSKPWEAKDAFLKAIQDRQLCDFTIDSPLLQRIWKQLLLGWVDIENEYYSLLTEEKFTMGKGMVHPDYNKLNNHLDKLQVKLIEYLKLESEKEIHVIDDIKDKIYSPIDEREISVTYKSEDNMGVFEGKEPDRIMLLNFNYTSTPEHYVIDPSKVTINYIHGRLEDPESIIFGYGDESDVNYIRLQNLDNNECLRHIKSIRYLEADSYRKMLEFIESAPFQICIMGHSCGNSDRTLLKTLFEHRNCISIKPYYYIKDGKNNHLDLIQNISRSFSDKRQMRDRVVNKTFCGPLVEPC